MMKNNNKADSGMQWLDSSKVTAVQNQWLADVQAMMQGWQGNVDPIAMTDRRFSSASWQGQKSSNATAQWYLLQSQTLLKMVDCMDVEARQKNKVRFAVQQFIDAVSPANFFVTNPDAQALMLKTQGQSLVQGLHNMMGDMRKGHISLTDESAFEVGRNVGTSAGAVIFENTLVQLIQYAPLTPKVGARPILFVPPCINKFYILDLQPENSLVRHLVENGHTVFMVSWRNVNSDQDEMTWDDYLNQGICETIATVQAITKQEQINVLGFCVGGTILTTALAALAAKGQKPAASLTLLTTFLDFSDTGALGLMVDESFMDWRDQSIGTKGLLKGSELSTTFSFLRPNDLVWNYVVNNYLKGESPPPFDLLYWNGDGTNLPGPMYCWYLRNTYFANQLRVPGACQSLGQAIDLGLVDTPTYILNTREDHIVPWTGGYESTQILTGPVRFVLGASGHIAGVVNSAKKNKRSYWAHPLPSAAKGKGKGKGKTKASPYAKDPKIWLDAATEHAGSWWNDWKQWLEPHLGAQIAAPKAPGNTKFKAIEPAPGRYVKESASTG